MPWIVPNQGKDIEIRSNGSFLQYRYVSSIDWQNIMPIEEIAGESSNTITTEILSIPPVNSTVTVGVEQTDFVVIGSTVLIRGVDSNQTEILFHAEVTDIDAVAKTLSLKALGYPGDGTGTLVIGAKIVPAGKMGPEGISPIDSIRMPLIIPSPVVQDILILGPFQDGATLSSIIHKTASGTLSFTAKINGVNVTGLSSINAGTTKTTTNATANNQLTSNQDLILSITSISSPVNLSLTFVFSNIL